jgi:DNA-nicking Smr family endonuclease
VTRRLRPDEERLWAKVADSTRPLMARPQPPATAAMNPQPHRPTVVTDRGLPIAIEVRSAQTKAPLSATLDRTWDRKLRTGAILPDLIVDLHGYSRDRAHHALMRAIDRAQSRRDRVILVITGKGRQTRENDEKSDQPSGVLRQSLPIWLDTPDLRRTIAALRPAHPRHGGDGAWYLILKRHRELN